MGTRADFYVGRGENAEWLGSIAWDGYPSGIPAKLLAAKDEKTYRRLVSSFLKDRDDRSLPADGWPWPWDTSSTTDYAYAFDKGHVRASCFGHSWFNPRRPEPQKETPKDAVFPDMSKLKRRPTFGAHSGVLLISG